MLSEPGYYKEGDFGIRIENVIQVIDDQDNFITFQDVTLVPIQRKLIDESLLTPEEVMSYSYFMGIHTN